MSNEEIVKEIQSGHDVKANTEKLWKQNKGMAHRCAYRYSRAAPSPNDELQDLEQEAFLVMENSVRQYNPDGGANFISFFTQGLIWHMQRCIISNMTVRASYKTEKLFKAYKNFISDFRRDNGRIPTDEEIMEALGINRKALEDIKAAHYTHARTVSLDAETSAEGEEATIGDLIPDNSTDIENDFINRAETDALWAAVDRLSPRQSKCIRKVYMEEKTLQKVGDELGVSKQAVDQSVKNGLDRLRQNKTLHDMMDEYSERMAADAYRQRGVASFQRTGESSVEAAAFRDLKLRQELANRAREILRQQDAL